MSGLHVALTLGVSTAPGSPVTCDCYYTLMLFQTWMTFFYSVELFLAKCSCCSFIEGENPYVVLIYTSAYSIPCHVQFQDTQKPISFGMIDLKLGVAHRHIPTFDFM